MTPTRKAPRVQARTAGQVARETRGDDGDSTTPTGDDLRRMRERRGLTRPEAARVLAETTGLSAHAWQVAIGDYERGAKVPGPDRIAALLAVYSPEPDEACRQDVVDALRVLGPCVDRHGPERVGAVVAEYAGVLRLTADVVEQRAARRRR